MGLVQEWNEAIPGLCLKQNIAINSNVPPHVCIQRHLSYGCRDQGDCGAEFRNYKEKCNELATQLLNSQPLWNYQMEGEEKESNHLWMDSFGGSHCRFWAPTVPFGVGSWGVWSYFPWIHCFLVRKGFNRTTLRSWCTLSGAGGHCGEDLTPALFITRAVETEIS